LSSGSFNFAHKLVQQRRAPRQERDPRTHPAETERDIASDTAGGTGYQCRTIAEIVTV
jgi:hypothetical protein